MLAKRMGGVNVIAEADVKLGTIMTTFGGGLRFSTLNFLQQSGNNMIMSQGNSKDNFGWKFDMGLNYRYVHRNSTLQGLGFINTFPKDDYDKDKPNTYVLMESEIERHMFIFDFGFIVKSLKTTVFLRQTFDNLEYKSRLDGLNYKDSKFTESIERYEDETYQEYQGFYNEKVVIEQNSFINNKFLGRTTYGYGTLGVSWIIE